MLRPPYPARTPGGRNRSSSVYCGVFLPLTWDARLFLGQSRRKGLVYHERTAISRAGVTACSSSILSVNLSNPAFSAVRTILNYGRSNLSSATATITTPSPTDLTIDSKGSQCPSLLNLDQAPHLDPSLQPLPRFFWLVPPNQGRQFLKPATALITSGESMRQDNVVTQG